MKITALVEAMVEAGATPAMILVAVRATEAQDALALEQRRKSDAERQSRKRGRDAVSRDVTLRHSDRSLTGAGDARVEVLTSKTDTHNSSEKKIVAPSARDDLVAFKAALPELTGDRLDAFLALRKAKRAVCTPHAASVFRGAAQRCGMTIPEAADKCIERNWITVNPDWLATPPARGSPKSNVPTESQMFGIIAKAGQHDHSQIRPAENGDSPRQIVHHLSIAKSG